MTKHWFCYERRVGMKPIPVLYHRRHPKTHSTTVIKNTIMEVPSTFTLREAEELFLFQSGGGNFVNS